MLGCFKNIVPQASLMSEEAINSGFELKELN